ncbi:MAG: IS21 family transposase [Peptococcaceae bacterium]|nr:IS21 family transposase [Peptococcaceae bacterium]
MYSLEEVFMFRELHKDGVTVTEISEIMNCSRTTVCKYLSTLPEPQERPKRPSILDPYKPYILKRVLEDRVTNCAVLLDELKEMGYPGSRTILREFVHPYRESPRKQAPVRFETTPGEQAQADWVHLGRHYIDGKKRQVYGFLMTLAYSRMRYLEVTTSMDLKTLIRVHMNAFLYFNGIPRTLAYDNIKTVVQRRLASEIILTRQFADFSDYYGFEVKLCNPGNPRSNYYNRDMMD